MDFNQAARLLRVFMRNDKPTFLWGAPGVGKSDLVRETSVDLHKSTGKAHPIIDFRAILRDPVDLRGIPAVDLENGVARWLPPSDLPNEIRHGEVGILFLDELNAAPPSVQAACFGLVLDRKIAEYQLPPGWRIVAAGNRQSDGAAAQRMPSPLANRFAHIDVDHSVDATVAHALRTGSIDPMILGLLRFKTNLLHDMTAKDLRAYPTPRSWEMFSDVYRDIKDTGDDDLVLDAAGSIVGPGAASELVGFLRNFKQLPTFEEIMKNPESAKTPTEPSGCYAAASMLSAKITPAQMDASSTYLRRVGEEFRGMMMFDLIKRDKDAFEKTKTFIDWVMNTNNKQANARF